MVSFSGNMYAKVNTVDNEGCLHKQKRIIN